MGVDPRLLSYAPSNTSSRACLIITDPDKAVKVFDTWVFERALKIKDPFVRYASCFAMTDPDTCEVSSTPENIPEPTEEKFSGMSHVKHG